MMGSSFRGENGKISFSMPFSVKVIEYTFEP